MMVPNAHSPMKKCSRGSRNFTPSTGAGVQRKAPEISLYIYIYAVKLKAGPIVALFKVKTGQFFCFFFENLILPAE